ncbi:MAG: energy transducer TonB [Mucilaginibacter sp.]|nr:energy transducer TonB [Mucilaginibacter sp.]
MLISKFDLYKPEWLELVFDDRNKEYGAYDLRKHYAGNLVKAMGITFFSVALLFIGHDILFKHKPVEHTRTFTDIPIIPAKDIIKPPITPPRVELPKPHVQVNTIKFPPPVVTPDDIATNPPKITELQTAAIGTKTVKGQDDAANIDIPETGSGSGIAKITEDNTPKEMNSVEILPQPVGGAEAWSRFLQKNMHYPPQAMDAHAQGKVFLSFIVEKDGHLSNIVVERGVGYGLDEEAVRVLSRAPAWKPGIQNGRPVRVKFTLPINFMIPESD